MPCGSACCRTNSPPIQAPARHRTTTIMSLNRAMFIRTCRAARRRTACRSIADRQRRRSNPRRSDTETRSRRSRKHRRWPFGPLSGSGQRGPHRAPFLPPGLRKRAGVWDVVLPADCQIPFSAPLHFTSVAITGEGAQVGGGRFYGREGAHTTPRSLSVTVATPPENAGRSGSRCTHFPRPEPTAGIFVLDVGALLVPMASAVNTIFHSSSVRYLSVGFLGLFNPTSLSASRRISMTMPDAPSRSSSRCQRS